MLQASSRLSSTFSLRQKDFCFFCSSRRTHLGQGTDFSLHSEWNTAPQLSHLQEPTRDTMSKTHMPETPGPARRSGHKMRFQTALPLGRGMTHGNGRFRFPSVPG